MTIVMDRMVTMVMAHPRLALFLAPLFARFRAGLCRNSALRGSYLGSALSGRCLGDGRKCATASHSHCTR